MSNDENTSQAQWSGQQLGKLNTTYIVEFNGKTKHHKMNRSRHVLWQKWSTVVQVV